MADDEAAALPLGTAQPKPDGIHRGHTPPERQARREVSHELHLLPQVREAVLPDAAAQGENDMKCELYHDNFQNFKRYNVPKAHAYQTVL